MPVGLVVLKAGVDRDRRASSSPSWSPLVRERIGRGGVVQGGDRGRPAAEDPSGKILRSTMRSIADGKDVAVPSTIEDPAVLDEISEDLKRRHSW